MSAINPLQAPFALEHQLISGLIQNRETTETWEKRRRDHLELLNNLAMYPDQMKHQVFAPLGKKAMMKANLIHTNEILVSLGVGWFVKVSAKGATDICQRRIKECDQMLKKCEAERVLYESRRDAKLRQEAFGGKEIIEKFDEKEEEKWKEEHKEKVKKHKQQLATVKDKLKQSTTETEEELWKHLDMLELQEELEDELTRLGEDDDLPEGEGSSEESSEDDLSPNEEPTSERLKKTDSDQKKQVRFGLDSITEIPPPSEPDAELVQTTAVKEAIVESNLVHSSSTTKSTRPASKFKKSRQNAPD